MNADFVRFNTERFHTEVKLTLTLDKRGRSEGSFFFPHRRVDISDVGIVWNRRVHQPELPDVFQDEPELQEWMLEETKWAFSIAITMLNCPVVNPWEDNERLKFNKMLQMRRAAELGFEIPASILTDEPDDIRQFWSDGGGEIIMKKIRKGLIHLKSGKRVLFHTSRIPPEAQTEAALERLRFTPNLMQTHIPKKYDIRSVVVGDQVFSVAIHSQELPEGKVDYRTAGLLGKLAQMKHEIIDLGREANERMVRFSRSFGLTFGAFDFIQTPDDRLVFLEDNPNGQWAWLEHVTSVKISEAIAQLLKEQAA
jgi:glutathione synthase/RimK-type ligase-like ATP-grasp enzyme